MLEAWHMRRRRTLFAWLLGCVLALSSGSGGRMLAAQPASAAPTAAARVLEQEGWVVPGLRLAAAITAPGLDAPRSARPALIRISAGTPPLSRAIALRRDGESVEIAVDEWQARIEIVWPHADAPVAQAGLANITAFLVSIRGNDPPPCAWEPVVLLWEALNTAPARQIAVGEKRIVSTGGRTYPVWDFNDVDVRPARDPVQRLHFFVTVSGVQVRHNVWTHGADSRTTFPTADVPVETIYREPFAVDARIEVLWPHGGEPARLANVTAILFAPGSLRAISPDAGWDPVVRLRTAVNTASAESLALSSRGEQRVLTTDAGLTFLAWDFNDVDISAALDPMNKMYFWITVDNVPTFSNIWTYGSTAPTLYPQQDILNSCQ